jgi:hypothetical protein
VLDELSVATRTIDVETFGAAGDTPVDVAVASSFVVDVVICGAVEVEETNGGAFSMYEPDGWTA